MARTTFFLVVLFVTIVGVALGQNCAVDPTQDPGTLWYTSASSVTGVDVSQVSPSASDLSAYLDQTSALGYLGPIGPYGPLGTLGPLGSNSWNPSYWISGFGNWDQFSQQVTGLGGPLSESGPLGSNGPLTTTQYYQNMPCLGDFDAQMLAGGLFSVLGPIGPLGPLGPLGATGYSTDSHGQFLDSSGTVQRTIDVPYDGSGTTRTFELFEIYTQSFAHSFKQLDTSFGVYATYSTKTTSTFTFTSAVAQAVTILVTPNYQLDAYSLTVKDGSGNTITTTSQTTFPPWVQIRVAAGAQLSVTVVNTYHGHLLGMDYRLWVVGSTNQFQDTDITGPQIIPYGLTG